MHGEEFFFQAFVFLASAVIAVPLAKRLGLGSVLGYLIAGIVIGPFGVGLLGDEGKDVMHFAEFGVVMMLFLVGLELRPSLLWRLRGPILGLGGLQVGVTTILGTPLGMAAGLDWRTALAVAMTLALSSTAIVLQTLTEKGLRKTDAGQSAFSVLLFQDVAVIPMLAILPLLAVQQASGPEAGHAAGNWVAELPAWLQTLAVLAVVGAIVVGGHFLARPAFRFVARTRLRETFTAASLLLVVGVALLMTRLGLSPALGTFIAGVVLANSEYRHELESEIDPFKGLLLGVFFIAVGASIDFALIFAQPVLIAALVLALIAIKWGVLFGLGRIFRMGLDQNLVFAATLAQGGEFAFVLFSFSIQSGVVTGEVADPLIAAVAISMALTPLLILANERLVLPRVGTRERAGREPDSIGERNPVVIAGFGRFGSVVGRLLRANGVEATVLEYDSDRVELLRRLGFKVYYGDATRPDLLHSAGAEEARLLVLAIDDHAKVMEMLQTVEKHFPHLTILARAKGRPEAYELAEAGVSHIYRDTLDTSLRMAIDALRSLGHPAYGAHRAARTFRRHDEESILDLAKVRDDEAAYLTIAKQRIADLEQILLAEVESDDAERDAGWDIRSLRSDADLS